MLDTVMGIRAIEVFTPAVCHLLKLPSKPLTHLPSLEVDVEFEEIYAMAKAMWKGTVIAESDNCQTVEGNTYFPADSLKKEFFTDSPTQPAYAAGRELQITSA
jgi:hypothetical protein